MKIKVIDKKSGAELEFENILGLKSWLNPFEYTGGSIYDTDCFKNMCEKMSKDLKSEEDSYEIFD